MTEKSSNSVESISGSSFSIEQQSMTPLFSSLQQEEQAKALQMARKIDVSRYENVLNFGVEVQQALKTFTHNMLVNVQRNDTSPIREVLFKLMEQLEKINPDELIEQNKGFFAKLFNRSTSSIQEVISQYNRLSKQIDRLSIQLQHAQKGLLADMNMLNDLFRLNEDYFHRINIYIAAGELKKTDLLNNDLKELQQVAMQSQNPMDQQRIADLQNSIEWLDKRLYDLQISREIAIQAAPQIRLIQQTNEMLVEKIQSSVMTTIPLWQSQISILVNINNQRRANIASERLMNTSDEMMRKNAKMIDVTRKDAKRHQAISHQDIDAFKQTQLQLLESIEDTLRVQADTNKQHVAVEQKLIEIDQQ